MLVASGTATLETALYKRPMVIAYRMPACSAWLMRRKKMIPWVGLPNILAGEFLVPELLQEQRDSRGAGRCIASAIARCPSRTRVEQRFAAMHRRTQARYGIPGRRSHTGSRATMSVRRARGQPDLFEQAGAPGRRICGIDEAGRGPLAGPVVAAAVILDTAAQDRWSRRLQGVESPRAARTWRC